MVGLLLSHGSYKDVLDHWNCGVAHHAVYGRCNAVFEALKDAGICWKGKCTWRFMARCANGEASLVFQRKDVTILHIAVWINSWEATLEWLFENIDLSDLVNAVTDGGETPLFIAAQCGYARTVNLLLHRSHDETLLVKAMHIAAECGWMEVLEEFLKFGCDLKVPDHLGLDCEILAWKYGHNETATTLRQLKGTHITSKSRALD